VPPALLDVIITVLSTLGRIVPPLAAKAECARIGSYDAAATASTGRDTLFEHYACLVQAGDPPLLSR
jgi:divinyl chlorophyllide a 8-vinyl-reductase